jgi:hypothetical protein
VPDWPDVLWKARDALGKAEEEEFNKVREECESKILTPMTWSGCWTSWSIISGMKYQGLVYRRNPGLQPKETIK